MAKRFAVEEQPFVENGETEGTRFGNSYQLYGTRNSRYHGTFLIW